MLSGLFIWLVFDRVSLKELKKIFISTDIIWIFASIIAFIIGYTCRIERWRQMLLHENPDSKWGRCAGPFVSSFAINNVLPFRFGDILRAFAFNKKLGTTSGIVIATIFIERMLDLLTILLVSVISIIIFGVEIYQFPTAGIVALIGFSVLVFMVLLFPNIILPFVKIIGAIVIRIFPFFGDKLTMEIEKGVEIVKIMSKGSNMVKLGMWSMLAWFFEGCVFWFAAHAIPSIVKPVGAWLAMPIGTLATLIPSTPGYIGTFDYFTIKAMLGFGNSEVASTAYALLVHTMLWIPPTVVGGLYLFYNSAYLNNWRSRKNGRE